MIARRGFIGGLLGVLAAPAIVRTPGLLMPVKRVVMPHGSPLALPFRETEEIVAANVLTYEDRLFFGGKEVPLGSDAGLMVSEDQGPEPLEKYLARTSEPQPESQQVREWLAQMRDPDAAWDSGSRLFAESAAPDA